MSDSASTGFWSYAHEDNDATNGHVRQLAEELVRAYKLNTGETLTLFVDRSKDTGLKWGDEWKEKISSTIAGTTFFIPIITPTYLRRPNCREEFLEFWAKAARSNLDELVLPILYVPVDLSDDTEDEICKIIKDIQHENWTETRLEDNKSSAYIKAVNGLARRLAEIASEVQDKPENTGPSKPDDAGSHDDNDDDDDSAPGLMDLMATAEAAMDVAESHIGEMADAIGKVGAAFDSVPNLAKSASSAARLSALKRLGTGLNPAASEFAASTSQLENTFGSIGLGLSALIDYSKGRQLSDAELVDLTEVAQSISELKKNMTLDDSYYDMLQTLQSMGAMSRDLRKPVKVMEMGFRSLESAIGMVDRWDRTMWSLVNIKVPTSPALPDVRVENRGKHNYRLIIQNQSTSTTAEQLTVNFGELGKTAYRENDDPFDLHPMAQMSWPLALDMGSPTRATIELHWKENGQPREKTQLISTFGN